jgi:EAL domain-containing protein (putative c-di-GMP-specific phosphodiesterase class I)/CheY-like chemotaxis protein
MANSAVEALKVLENNNVHLIISDQRMPNMTGLEMFKQVKIKYPHIILIILSAYTDFNVLKDAINGGVIYKFFTKPWDDDELRQEIATAFQYRETIKDKEELLSRLLSYAKSVGFDEKKPVVDVVTKTELEQALNQNQFVIHFQPILDTAKLTIRSAEALIRWQHPQRGLLMPDQFIKQSEDLGLIADIDAWVLRSVCYQLQKWKKDKQKDISISINITAAGLLKPNFLDMLDMHLKETQIDPARLEFEITEGILMHDVEAYVMLMKKLRSKGIQISIDDFGTGFSSLSYLKVFPINTIKIDRSFISEITTNKNSLEIIKHIIDLAKSLNLSTTAEGVQTAEQLTLLQHLHCDKIQGYMFSRPIQESDFIQYLDKTDSSST